MPEAIIRLSLSLSLLLSSIQIKLKLVRADVPRQRNVKQTVFITVIKLGVAKDCSPFPVHALADSIGSTCRSNVDRHAFQLIIFRNF